MHTLPGIRLLIILAILYLSEIKVISDLMMFCPLFTGGFPCCHTIPQSSIEGTHSHKQVVVSGVKFIKSLSYVCNIYQSLFPKIFLHHVHSFVDELAIYFHNALFFIVKTKTRTRLSK